MPERVRDRRKWLIGAIYNASKNHLRRAKRIEQLPSMAPIWPIRGMSAPASNGQRSLRRGRRFARLTPRCHLALRLRFIEGHTVPSIAKLLETTNRYARADVYSELAGAATMLAAMQATMNVTPAR